MKLSEAIRLGAMLKPQGHEGYLVYQGQTCAMGAALDACGKLREERVPQYDKLFRLWPRLGEGVKNPMTGNTHRMFQVIEDLNDYHYWTREEIADWVETVENVDAGTSQPVEAPIESPVSGTR